MTEICGQRRCTPYLRYDQDTRSWRTSQASLITLTLDEFSGTWPRQGMMQGGACWEVEMLVDATSETDYGYLPTPNASDNRDRGDFSMPAISRRAKIGKQNGLSTYFKGRPCPMCVERIMAMPMGWTDLQPLETHKMQEWLQQRGAYYQDNNKEG